MDQKEREHLQALCDSTFEEFLNICCDTEDKKLAILKCFFEELKTRTKIKLSKVDIQDEWIALEKQLRQ